MRRRHADTWLLDHGSNRHRFAVFTIQRGVGRTLAFRLCQAEDGTKQSQCKTDARCSADHQLTLAICGRNVSGSLEKLSPIRVGCIGRPRLERAGGDEFGSI
jgi:hypothetical protein